MMHGWGGGGGGYGGGGFGGGGAARRFEEQYHCYSVAYADKAHLEKGDKILMPPSAFDTLARLQVDYPMLFQLTAGDRTTHCGVLEFTAEEGCVYIPFWMMQNLLIEEGSLLTVRNVSLPKATFVKLQPQSVDFLEISNPRAVLEHALRSYSCVTVGDVIQIPFNNKNYHLELKDVKPERAACIIETDCNVDFDAPVGYKEPTASASQRSSACPSPAASSMSTTSAAAGGGSENVEEKPRGTRIVDGKIVRPEDEGDGTGAGHVTPQTDMLAERAGATGVQKNAAIPEEAPTVDYWAVNAGDGARLDGKSLTPLKDASGREVDIRKLRAEAAAKRAAEAAAAASASAAKLQSSAGKTLNGKEVPPVAGDGQQQHPSSSASGAESAAPISKRKSRVGGKYSRLKQSGVAFQGSANKFNK